MLVRVDITCAEDEDNSYMMMSQYVQLESYNGGEYIKLHIGNERRTVLVRSAELLGAVQALCQVRE